MKASDSVMSRERIASIMATSEGIGYEKGIDIAEAQDEISFKAGYDKCLKDHKNLKELVEWISAHLETSDSSRWCGYVIHEEEWESKLKSLNM